ncbi:MAG: hypothetical protein Q8P57_03055 [Candidatus Pacearchaeota archaeon]|nr:hypothetical protein [Candidatus Pacearchaeota archaeon]
MNNKDNFHVDMSGRIYGNRTIGMALVGTKTKIHYGCVLKGNLLKFIKKNLFKGNIYEDSAKLYAICIYSLVREVKNNIDTLIVCNDENFKIVKKALSDLLGDYRFEIINITEFRKRLGRNVGSLADNYARIYRRRALKPKRLLKGKQLNIIPITYKIIKLSWEKLNGK